MEDAIAEAEKRTSGEIVTLILPASSDYWLLSFAAGTFGALTGAAIAYYWHFTHEAWGVSFEWALSLPLMGFLLGALPLRSASILRAIAPPAMLAAKVHREALAHFTALGVSKTRDRTGILLVLSLRERRVQLMADEGIHARHDDNFWKDLVEELVVAIRDGKATDGVVALIKKLADDLAQHFPIKDDDTDELSNRVLIGRQY